MRNMSHQSGRFGNFAHIFRITQTVVTINHYCSNTSTRNFREPFSFIPDRWLGDPAYDNDKKDVVQPFSVGPRNCPGKM